MLNDSCSVTRRSLIAIGISDGTVSGHESTIWAILLDSLRYFYDEAKVTRAVVATLIQPIRIHQTCQIIARTLSNRSKKFGFVAHVYVVTK